MCLFFCCLSPQNSSFLIKSYSVSLCCESILEERSAGNPHALKFNRSCRILLQGIGKTVILLLRS